MLACYGPVFMFDKSHGSRAGNGSDVTGCGRSGLWKCQPGTSLVVMSEYADTLFWLYKKLSITLSTILYFFYHYRYRLIFTIFWSIEYRLFFTFLLSISNPGSNPARTRKLIWSPNHARKHPKVKLGLKNLAMLPSYFDYMFLHLRQKVSLRPKLSPKFLSVLGPNRPEKPGPTYNSVAYNNGATQPVRIKLLPKFDNSLS